MTEREKFEALPEFVEDPGLLARGVNGGDYVYTRIAGMWAGWQMRAALAQPVAAEGWQPIKDAPTAHAEMFVVKAFNVRNGFTGPNPYTSDPWCTWREKDGGFARWPHNFPPTHFMRLPPTPA